LREVGGASLLQHAMRRVTAAPCVGCVVVAAPIGRAEQVAGELPATDAQLIVVDGGETRTASVAAALDAVPERFPIILVHDAARAFAPPDLVERVAAAVRAGHEAVIPVLPVVDTIKEIDAEGYVAATPARDSLRAVQTPQGFRRAVLERAHRNATGDSTDDAALVERLGIRVFCVPGSEAALKITHPADLVTAEQLALAR
jgi:2-C-methyl-D-erythritol 4-phosphate cytidylyltransferase